MNTARLLRAIQSGDRNAFEELVRNRSDRLYRIAYRITGVQETANDVLQETFLRLLTTKAPLREVRAADAWLFSPSAVEQRLEEISGS